DSVFEAHQLGEHLRTLDHRDKLRARRSDFRIVAADGRTGDHDLSARDVLGAMSFKNDGAELGQTFGDRRALHVGTGDAIAQRQQHFGDAAHADATYAYEMYSLNLCKHYLCRFAPHRSSAGIVFDTSLQLLTGRSGRKSASRLKDPILAILAL